MDGAGLNSYGSSSSSSSSGGSAISNGNGSNGGASGAVLTHNGHFNASDIRNNPLGLRLVISIWSLSGVALFFLVARCYCKFLRHRGLWWDDGILIASWVCITTESALMTYAVTLGYGYSINNYPPELLARAVDLILVIDIAGTFSLTAAIWSKTSFALTLLRLTEGWMKRLIWFIIVTMNIAMGLSALFIWIQCRPVQRSWNPFVEGTCWAPYVIVYYNIFSAAYSAAMDITLALLPWRLIWGLNMKKKEKIGVAVAMSFGIFAGITAIVKTTKIPAMLSMDPSDGIQLFIWGNAESCVTIIATSIPILRVLIRDVKATYRQYHTTYAGGESGDAGGNTTWWSKAKSRNNTVATTGNRTRVDTRRDERNDDDHGSEKSILKGRMSREQTGRIVMRYEVSAAEYSRDGRVGAGRNMSFEMDRVVR